MVGLTLIYAASGNSKEAKGISALWSSSEATEGAWPRSWELPRCFLLRQNGNNAHALPSGMYSCTFLDYIREKKKKN